MKPPKYRVKYIDGLTTIGYIQIRLFGFYWRDWRHPLAQEKILEPLVERLNKYG